MNPDSPSDAPAASARDDAAERRDLAAEERDRAAEERELRHGVHGGSTSEEQVAMARRDRTSSAEDRRASAIDRQAARSDIAQEGIDSLTGVMRRGVGLAAVQREIDRVERSGESLVLAYVDAVGLKAINDSHGHRAGDRVLREIAQTIGEDLRSYDVVARVGGDEFIGTLAGQSLDEVERRYRAIARRLEDRGKGSGFTFGLALRLSGDTVEDLVDRADRAMLADRRPASDHRGRN